MAAREYNSRDTVMFFHQVLVVFYLSWRLFYTLNPLQPLASCLLLLADVFAGISSILFYTAFQSSHQTKESVDTNDGYSYKPSVDVLVPTLNEGIDILERTVAGCKAMEYPHTTYILDDGDRQEVRELAKNAGINYISRKTNLHAKAGNLNNALKEITGDLMVVFDADFAPDTTFLNDIICCFKDESVAVVQTPQEYFNTDSFQHISMPNGRTYNDQDFFMRSVMPARNDWNAAYWIGTNAVIRRKAVDSIGGFATESVTEDLLTSIKLHEKGWKIVYIDEPMASGLAPENASRYFIQRRRWAQGAIQVLTKHNPLLSRDLSVMQRLLYFSSILHFIDGAFKLLFYLFPALFFIAGITPVTSSPTVIIIMVLYYFLSIFVRSFIVRRSFSYFIYDEIYSVIRSFPYLSAFNAFLPYKKINFAVTPKSTRDDISIKSILGPIIVFTVNCAAVLLVVFDGRTLLNGELLSLFCFFWCLGFCVISGAASYISVASFTNKHEIVSTSIFNTIFKRKFNYPAHFYRFLLIVVMVLCGNSVRMVPFPENAPIPVITVSQNFDKLIGIKRWGAVGPFEGSQATKSPAKSLFGLNMKKYGVNGKDFGYADIEKLVRLTGNWCPINGSTSFVRLFDYVGSSANIQRLGSFYLFTSIECGEETEATLIFDGSNSYELWLNGILLGGAHGKLNINKVGDRYANVVLNKGKNILMAKISRGTNLKSWDFVCGIAPLTIAKDIYKSNYLGDFIVNPIVDDSLAVYTGPYGKAVISITDDKGVIVVTDTLSPSNNFSVSLPENMPEGFYSCCLYLDTDSIAEDIYKGTYHDFIVAVDTKIRSTGLSENDDVMANLARVSFLSDETVDDGSPDELRRLNRNRVYWGRALSRMVEAMSSSKEINGLEGTFLLTYDMGNDSGTYHFVSHVGDDLPRTGKIPVVFAVPYGLTGDYMPEDWYIGNLDQIVNDNYMADKYGFALIWLYSRGKDYFPLTAEKDLLFALEKMRSLYDIDTARLFLVGDCEGGRRAMALARDNPGLFRGIAATSPLTLTGNGDIAPVDYAGKLVKIPMIIRHGKYDEVAGIENSTEFVAVANSLDFYPQLMLTDDSHITFNRDYRGYAFSFFDSINKIVSK